MASVQYDDDFYGWTQHQAKLIRAVPSLCREVPRGLDIENLAEEVEDLGRSQLSAVESHVRNLLTHIVKVVSDPDCPAVNHWLGEIKTFQAGAKSSYSPSMRQKLDLDEIWQDAIETAGYRLRDYAVDVLSGLPGECPFSIDELISRKTSPEEKCQQLLVSVSEHKFS